MMASRTDVPDDAAKYGAGAGSESPDLLTCAEGGQNTEVAAKLGLNRPTVGKSRESVGKLP